MREGWEILDFEKCLLKVPSTAKIPKKKFLTEGAFPIVSQEEEYINGYWHNEDDVFKVEKPVVLFGDHTKIVKLVDFDFVKGADGIKVFLPKEDINSKFFAYKLQSLELKDLGYARHYRLLKKKKISIPPLPEQKQIVAILDKAFAAIDQAQANIEKNIENAKELFQSKLNNIFSQKSNGWVTEAFSKLLKLKSGDGLTAKNMIEGPFPVYGGNGIAGYHNEYNFESPEVIVGRVGAWCGNVRVVKEKFWLTDNAFRIANDLEGFDLDFLVYLLNNADLRSFARQAAQPVISNSSLKDVMITYPISKEVQKEIVMELDSIDSELNNLSLSYREKLQSLKELKSSILQKAFSGELTQKPIAV